jgi:hypothetical protein
MEKLELLPCPFCGGKARIDQTGKNKLKLKCANCLIGIEQKTIRYGLEWLENRMIEGWNKRV